MTTKSRPRRFWVAAAAALLFCPAAFSARPAPGLFPEASSGEKVQGVDAVSSASEREKERKKKRKKKKAPEKSS